MTHMKKNYPGIQGQGQDFVRHLRVAFISEKYQNYKKYLLFDFGSIVYSFLCPLWLNWVDYICGILRELEDRLVIPVGISDGKKRFPDSRSVQWT